MNPRQTEPGAPALPDVRPQAAPALARGWRMLLLFAFAVQGILVQSHVHPIDAPAPSAPVFSHSAGQQMQHLSTGERVVAQDYCLLCWEAAMAGHYVLPAADIVSLLPVIAPWIVVQAMPEFGLHPLSHAWLSRAPPQ